MKTYKGKIEKLLPHQYFVFGSNTEGRHGKGAALYAKLNFGAEYGKSRGRQGKSYAIITKNLKSRYHPSVSKTVIKQQIKDLYELARLEYHLEFFIAYTGSQETLNGYTIPEMAQMFACETPPKNIVFEEKFAKLVISYI